MLLAQRGYQANLAVVDRANEAYTEALQIGRPHDEHRPRSLPTAVARRRRRHRPAARPARRSPPTRQGFGDLVAQGLDQRPAMQTHADQLAVQAATGDLQSTSTTT